MVDTKYDYDADEYDPINTITSNSTITIQSNMFNNIHVKKLIYNYKHKIITIHKKLILENMM